MNTGRLLLREPNLDDAPAIFGLYSDPKVMEHTDDPPYLELERACLRIRSWAARTEQGTGLKWVLERSGVVIGACGLHSLVSAHRRAAVGFELTPDHWRKGYMREALGAVLELAFGAAGLRKIEAHTTAPNAVASAFLKSIGFQEDGLLREHAFWKNEFHDLRVFSILSDEWRREVASPS